MIYFDNPYRILGTYADVTRGEARSILQRMKVRSRMAGAGDTDDPLTPLGRVQRSEDAVRDAFNALGNLRLRLEHRLLWFTNRNSRDAYALQCIADRDYTGAVEAWGSTHESDARANLARLYHVLLITRDVQHRIEGNAVAHPYSWSDMVRSWAVVDADERFWRDLALADAASGFEPAALGADIAALRKDLWNILLGPSVELAARFVEKGEYGAARAHLDDLEVGGLPPHRIAALERDAFAPFISRLDGAIDDVMAAAEVRVDVSMAARDGYTSYHAHVVPLIRELLRLAGFNFEPAKLACRRASECLNGLVVKAIAAQDIAFANAMHAEAQSLMKGEIQEEKNLSAYDVRRPSSSHTSRSGGGRRGRIPWWVYTAVLFALTAGLLRNSDSGSSSLSIEQLSRYQQERYDRSAYEEKLLDSALNVIRDTLGDLSKSFSSISDAYTLKYRLELHEQSLKGYGAQLEKIVAGLERLDSTAATVEGEDSAQHVLLERGVVSWKSRLLSEWKKFDERYEGYTDTLEIYNKLAKQFEEQKKLYQIEKRSIPEELSELYNRNRRKMKRWKLISCLLPSPHQEYLRT